MDRRTLRFLGTMVACAVVGFFAFVRGVRVPILGHFDFGMHELGHLLFIWAPEVVHFLAGSVWQVVVPLGLAGYFWSIRRDLASTAFLLAWTGASLHDVSVYIADAPYERLPLIGGDHDWAFLLHGWDKMDLAEPLAAWVAGIGGFLVVASIGLAAAGPWIEERIVRGESVPAVEFRPPAADTPHDPWM
jgi:hypothetical protein